MTDNAKTRYQTRYPHLIIESKPIRKKGRFSKWIVALCVLLAAGYTGFCLWMQYNKGVPPDGALTGAWFGFITVELWNLAKIKRFKKRDDEVRKEEREEGEEENERGRGF